MTDPYVTEPEGAETTSECACCGCSVFNGSGWLLHGSDEAAFYLYRWTEGHEVAFSLAVAGCTQDGHMRPGFVALSCRQVGADLSYSVSEPQDAPWSDSEDLGPVLSRKDALDSLLHYQDLWHLVDTIVELEPRLARRITALQA